jgi:CheY-like chemotaxis protein
MKPLSGTPLSTSELEDNKDAPLVLYVEDDDENWNVTELRLRPKFRLIRARTDIEACEALRANADQLLAVLMDIELKGSALSGVQLTKLLRGQTLEREPPSYARALPTVDVPIIFVTAYGDRYPEKDLLIMGGNQVILKPVDFPKLALALERFGASRT